MEEVSSILPLRWLSEKPLFKDLISCSQEKEAASSGKIGEERTVVGSRQLSEQQRIVVDLMMLNIRMLRMKRASL